MTTDIFDARAYKAVLKETSRKSSLGPISSALRSLRDDGSSLAYADLDLATLFAVPDTGSSEVLAQWEKALRSTLNKHATGSHAAPILKELLDKIAENNDIRSPDFWRTLKGKKKKADRRRLTTAVRQILPEFPLKAATEDQLLERLQSTGFPDIDRTTVLAVAGELKFTLCPVLDTGQELDPALRQAWTSVSRYPEFRSILDLLLLHRDTTETATGVHVVDGLATDTAAVTVQDVTRSRRHTQLKDTDANKAAGVFLKALEEHAAGKGQLRDAVLATLVADTLRKLRKLTPQQTVYSELTGAGVHPGDARTIVVNCAAGTAGRPSPAPTTDQVSEALAAGHLVQAESLLSGVVDSDPAVEDIRQRVAHRREEKDRLVAEYERAAAAGELAAAAEALTRATAVDVDDGRLRDLLSALPPTPPDVPVLHASDRSVVVSWHGSSSTGVLFSVVRAEGHIPVSRSDGTEIAALIPRRTVTDEDPPAGRSLGYGVFATFDGENFSAPAGAEILLLPAPYNVNLEIGTDSALLAWAPLPLAAATEVTVSGADGSRLSKLVSRGTNVQLDDLTTGVTYQASLTAVYLVNGERHRSTPTSVTVIPRHQARPVTDLDIAMREDHLECRYSEQPGFATEIWSFPPAAPITSGQVASPGQLRDLRGEKLALLPMNTASPNTRHVGVPRQIRKLVTGVLTDNGVLLGNAVTTGRLTPVPDATAERFDDELRISWSWPNQDGNPDTVVQVEWIQAGRPRGRRVTPARYRADGGVVLTDARRISDIRVRSLARVGDEELFSPPTTVPVPVAPSAPLPYSLDIRRSRISRRASCTVTVDTSTLRHPVELLVVLCVSAYLPTNADAGRVISRLSTGPGDTEPVTVDLGKTPSPFWVRLFPTDPGVVLLDPPTDRMKG